MSRLQNPTEHQVSLARGVTMRFRRIDPGEFRMGGRGEYADEEPIHRVRITRPFYLGVYPVTQAQFAVWTKLKGVDHKNHFGGKNHPAENLDWNQATQYCDWLNEDCHARFPAGFVATLPTEAQWEYACRAGTDTQYNTGDGAAALARTGWYDESSTHPVGEKEPNSWGLCDMHGNVWEWCKDVWDEHAYQRRVDGITDPVSALDEGSKVPGRVMRGGSWNDTARGCRSAVRNRWRPDFRNWDTGFRVCLVPGPASVK